MKVLILINDAPYGTEKAYNAFRVAMTLQKEHPEVEVRVFLMADAVGCAIPNQITPQGYYN
ncbi:MAG: DsrE family protein, partial [Bacteroidota bacterium]